MAGIALRDPVDLFSKMAPLEVAAKIIIIIINNEFYVIWIQHNLIRPNHECERGCAVLVEHICVFFLPLYIFEKVVFDLMLE